MRRLVVCHADHGALRASVLVATEGGTNHANALAGKS